MKEFHIILDCGHGMNDTTKGKFSPILTSDEFNLRDITVYQNRFREGNLNRIIGQRLERMLIDAGLDVHTVSDDYNDNPLSDRVKKANQIAAKYGKDKCIYVSIHSNALGYGDEWYPNANYWTVWTTVGKTNSDKLATCLWEACKEVMPDKKFGKDMKDGDVDYESNFYIIKKANCPAVLTENFFYTCKENLNFIASEQGRELIAEGHVKGIINYLKTKNN